MARPPGRPRQFDPETALNRARDVFWTRGFAAASLDDLARAMGINRPSLYAAFGDKQALYAAALEQFVGEMRAGALASFDAGEDPRARLLAFYTAAIAVYTQGDDQPRGCFVLGTALSECPTNPAIRARVAAVMAEIDAICARLAGSPVTGTLAASILHGLAARARAGTPASELAVIAASAVDRLLPP